jgi:hypothetical protein
MLRNGFVALLITFAAFAYLYGAKMVDDALGVGDGRRKAVFSSS